MALAKGASLNMGMLKLEPQVNCTSKRYLVKLVLPTAWDLSCHSPCLHNEVRSLKFRVLEKTPDPHMPTINLLMKQAVVMAKKLGFTAPLVGEELISCFPVARRKIYRRAADSLKAKPLLRSDAFVKAFVKSEKLQIKENNKDPRMIQARSVRFNLSLAQFSRALEHKLYQMRDTDGTRLVAKGQNMRARAATLKQIWEKYEQPAALSLDLSRWDKHCNVELIKVMHKFYLTALPDAEHQALLTAQLKNVGVTTNGVWYKRPGGVMSGDMTTALGNCILLIIIQLTFRKDFLSKQPHLKPWSLYDDGDDHVIIGEKSVLELIKAPMEEWFNLVGHKMTVDGHTTNFNQITFCQHKPLQHHGLLEMMPNPSKVLATAMIVPGAKDATVYLPEVWAARALLHQGQPILGPFFRILSKRFPPGSMRWGNQLTGLEFQMRMDRRTKLTLEDVEVDTRAMVEEMWNISPEDQVQLEELAWKIEFPTPSNTIKTFVRGTPQGIVEHVV